MFKKIILAVFCSFLIIDLGQAFDRTGIDWQFIPPADLGVINVKDYGAVGDGKTDDTAAIAKAIAENIDKSRYRCNPMFYFPNGTYLVSGPIESRNYNNLGFGAGWRAMAVLIGETREGVTIKLKDNAAGYGDATKPKWVVSFGSESNKKTNVKGGGNRAFRHGLINMTIDVGNGNPGAIGVDFIASNRGTIDNVTIKSGPNSGHTGIAMTRSWPGPAMIMDTDIHGFDVGMTLGHYQYGMTFENMHMTGQRKAGITNKANVLTMRRIKFEGTVPFYQAGHGHSMLCLLDSELIGTGTSAQAAISTGGTINLRRVSVTGYQLAIKDTKKKGGKDLPAASMIDSYDMGFVISGKGKAEPLDLPIEEIPVIRPPRGTQWTDAGTTGESFQAAIDSGAEYICVRPDHTFNLDQPLILRGNVKLIFGMNGFVKPAEKGKTAIIVADGAAPVIQLEHMYIGGSIIHESTRTFVLRHGDNGPHPVVGKGRGKTHIIDVIGRNYQIHSGHQFWGRQVNSEFGNDPLFSNLGGTSWLLGFKMESSSFSEKSGSTGTPSFVNNGGGKMEVFGGLLYTLGNGAKQAPQVPAFTNEYGAIAVSYRTNGRPGTYYKQILSTDGKDTIISSKDIKGPSAALLSDKR